MIETTRLLLRQPTQADVLILGALWRNEVVRTYLGGIVSDELINEKIQILNAHWAQHGFGMSTVVEKSTNTIIGLCGPHYSEESIEVSYMFFPEYWGKGFAKEALIASVGYCFKSLELEKVIAITQKVNERSCRLLESVGMRLVNTFERFNAVQRTYELETRKIAGIVHYTNKP